MADPAKVAIWEERVGAATRAVRVYFRRNASTGVIELTNASANEDQYPVKQGTVIGMQPYAGSGAVVARTGTNGIATITVSGTADQSDWYETRWLKSVSGHIEATEDFTEEDAYFTLVSGHVEFTTTDPADATLVTAADPLEKGVYFFDGSAT